MDKRLIFYLLFNHNLFVVVVVVIVVVVVVVVVRNALYFYLSFIYWNYFYAGEFSSK